MLWKKTGQNASTCEKLDLESMYYSLYLETLDDAITKVYRFTRYMFILLFTIKNWSFSTHKTLKIWFKGQKLTGHKGCMMQFHKVEPGKPSWKL